MDVTAATTYGGETHLVRTMESVAIPVFQFGMFSDVDLAFFAGPNFNFGGRVHTNGNLFLAEGNGATLTLAGKVTAVREIIRQRLQNTVSIDNSPHLGTVNMAKAPNVFVPLLRTWGSLVDGLGSAQNEPTWHTTSLSTYNTWIRNGRTGAKALNLPLLTVGGSNPDLIRRPPVGEDATNNVLYNERLYTKASIRILLSDLAADIQNLPGIDTTRTPVQLDGDWRAAPPNNGVAYNAGLGTDATHPPIARTPAPVSAVINNAAAVAAGTNKTLQIPLGVPLQWRSAADSRSPDRPPTARILGCELHWQDGDTFIGCTVTNPANHPSVTMRLLQTLRRLPRPLRRPTGARTSTSRRCLPRTGRSGTPRRAPATGGVITVASTMAFAPNTFWIGSDLVTCGGYDTASSIR